MQVYHTGGEVDSSVYIIESLAGDLIRRATPLKLPSKMQRGYSSLSWLASCGGLCVKYFSATLPTHFRRGVLPLAAWIMHAIVNSIRHVVE